MAEKQIPLGFHNCYISVFDNEAGDAPAQTDGSELIIVDNKDGNGAAQEVKISGIGGETKKQYGNDGVAFVSAKSLGDVKASFTALGIPMKQKARITGAKEHDGVYFLAPDSIVPSCAMWIESKTADGKLLCIGLLKGKGSLGDINLSTLDDGAAEPKGEELEFQFGTDGREGSSTDVMIHTVLDVEGTEKAKYEKLRDFVLRTQMHQEMRTRGKVE